VVSDKSSNDIISRIVDNTKALFGTQYDDFGPSYVLRKNYTGKI